MIYVLLLALFTARPVVVVTVHPPVGRPVHCLCTRR